MPAIRWAIVWAVLGTAGHPRVDIDAFIILAG
jgi:hypothetical protein